MDAHQSGDEPGEDRRVESIHLAEIEHVEERANAYGVQSILSLHRNPLCIEVLLGDVPGEGGEDRGQEGDDAGRPGQATSVAPCPLEERRPQMQHHEKEERLDGPEVDAVKEVAN